MRQRQFYRRFTHQQQAIGAHGQLLDAGRRFRDALHRPAATGGKRKDGSLFPISLSVSKIARPGRPTFVGVIRDITQRRQQEEEIQRLAFYDPLTQLPNRRPAAN